MGAVGGLRGGGGALQGVLPPHPRPLSPCGGEGRFGCRFSVFGFEFSVFSLAGQFVALREALRWLGGERSGSGRRSGTVRKNPCFAGSLTRFRVPGC
jgi:hypothetical protein